MKLKINLKAFALLLVMLLAPATAPFASAAATASEPAAGAALGGYGQGRLADGSCAAATAAGRRLASDVLDALYITLRASNPRIFKDSCRIVKNIA